MYKLGFLKSKILLSLCVIREIVPLFFLPCSPNSRRAGPAWPWATIASGRNISATKTQHENFSSRSYTITRITRDNSQGIKFQKF